MTFCGLLGGLAMLQWMRSTGTSQKKRLMILLALSLMVASCTSQSNRSVTWPQNLEVIQLSDGGVCLSPESAKELAQLRISLEAL